MSVVTLGWIRQTAQWTMTTLKHRNQASYITATFEENHEALYHLNHQVRYLENPRQMFSSNRPQRQSYSPLLSGLHL